MRQNELRGFIQKTLQEGVMEHETTILSRQIINWMKVNRDQKHLPAFDTTIGDIDVLVNFMRYGGPLKTGLASFKSSAGQKLIELKVLLPTEFNETQLNEFIPELKGKIRHELEHAQQKKRSPEKITKGSHYTNDQYKNMDYDPSLRSPYGSAENARSYFLTPIEIEAHVMELYKKAKMKKVPLIELINQKMSEITGNLRSNLVPRNEIIAVVKEINKAWKDYAVNRLKIDLNPFGVLP
jgi:hypothetical protein